MVTADYVKAHNPALWLRNEVKSACALDQTAELTSNTRRYRFPVDAGSFSFKERGQTFCAWELRPVQSLRSSFNAATQPATDTNTTTAKRTVRTHSQSPAPAPHRLYLLAFSRLTSHTLAECSRSYPFAPHSLPAPTYPPPPSAHTPFSSVHRACPET